MTMASPTFKQVAGMQARRTIEPTSAVSEDDTQEDTDMARRRGPMQPGPERDARMVELYQQGKTTKEIRDAVGLSYDSAIYLALQKAGISPRNRYNTANNGTITEDDLPEVVEVVAVDDSQVSVVTAPEPADVAPPPPDEPQPDGPKLDTYVLRVTLLQPVDVSIEVDAPSFDVAYDMAKVLPNLVGVLGVVRRDALQPHDGDA